jgi:hypothetical protein
VNIPPRGQISPLGASSPLGGKFTPGGQVHPWGPSSPLGARIEVKKKPLNTDRNLKRGVTVFILGRRREELVAALSTSVHTSKGKGKRAQQKI